MSLCQYTLVNQDKWGVAETIYWKRMYEGHEVTLINTIEYKWIQIDILMTEGEKMELERETVITMSDIEPFSWQIAEAREGTNDWEIKDDGKIPSEIILHLKNELEERGYMDIEDIDWEEQDSVIKLHENVLIFDE